MGKDIVIICKRVRYYTDIDKNLFFEWLDAIEGVESYTDTERELYLKLNIAMTNENLLDLVAVCERYRLGTSQLSFYMHENNKYWCGGKKFHVIYPQSNKNNKIKADENPNFIRLQCTPVDLYTQLDKNHMFEWMERIHSIKDIIGLGPVIYLYVDVNQITKQDILELEGLFNRYDFDGRQLDILSQGSKC